MKKTSATKKPSAQNFRRVIQLDASQMAIYKTGTIEILNPDGEQIDCIGKTTKQLNDDQIIEDTANNLRLIEDLLLCSSGEVQLSERAIVGLANSLSQVQRIIER